MAEPIQDDELYGEGMPEPEPRQDDESDADWDPDEEWEEHWQALDTRFSIACGIGRGC